MRNPIKVSLKTEIASLLTLAVGWTTAWYFYIKFEPQVATHWNFVGEVDGYSSSEVGAFLIPIIMVLMYVMFLVLPAADPKKNHYAAFAKPYVIFKTTILGLLLLIHLAMGAYNVGYPIEIGKTVPMVIGIAVVIMSGWMGKLKQNWFMGIRTPWTLSSERVWDKTHRMGRWAFLVFGVLVLTAPFLPEKLGMVSFAFGVLLVTVGSMVYSYLVYRQEEKSK
ncbi:hypothetical protein A2397_01605 [Candidatus Amesbacteria bacterium RIFOXYB1_FULL_44_23]|uniref:DUF1648 domain-containing protein n=1 Tax=Candidatus Amesbacteria bacterium RIFOXYB1_FULL_44_23 TaxID=1797263 RepID=A0A1F4ZRS2_9BACT|nr:MAG: hypothetical protein A2397_01605 [Candidatus Amesbacteria bacterium RIFOXYB1_FULL_44_23]